MGIEVAIEISKSGNGAHAWIFFWQPVPAYKTRQIGDVILGRAMDARYCLDLGSYDRFFPNQDYLPKGGFGNLIALPLQKRYRKAGRSVFVDSELEPLYDQWEYLSQIHRLSLSDLDKLLVEYSSRNLYGSSKTIPDDVLLVSDNTVRMYTHTGIEQCTGEVQITLSGQVSVSFGELSTHAVQKLKRLATIANPKFFEAQRLRFSTWNIPKYIFCGENDIENLYLPRGLIKEIEQALLELGYTTRVHDQRNQNSNTDLTFSGQLGEDQKNAVQTLLKLDYAVLVAPTGTGKTVMALSILATRQMRTLVLVHRSTLIDQWIQAICKFIPEITRKDIGVLGAGRKKLKGTIDIAMLQSISGMEDIRELTSGYDFLIVDECHRVPTVKFEPVLKEIACRAVLGLTATPQRKDRYESIVYMQCGPVGYTLDDIHRASQQRLVYFRETPTEDPGKMDHIHEIWDFLINASDRNAMIVSDIQSLLKENRSPVIISDRVEHITILSELLGKFFECPILILTGGLGKRARKDVLARVTDYGADGTPFCLFATGSLIGEGFDMPDLDTLLISMPISFRGRLTQYVGRLHRQNNHDTKEIRVYDYVDTCSGMTISMFKKRLTTYRKLGYQPVYTQTDKIAKWIK